MKQTKPEKASIDKNWNFIYNKNMKVIDFKKKGNVVKLFLGLGTDDYGGDDWDDVPYDCNAEPVDKDYVTGTVEIMFPFDYSVLEPKDPEWEPCPWCKDDMKIRRIPCLVAVKCDEGEAEEYFNRAVGNDKSIRIYFGDYIEELRKKLAKIDSNIKIGKIRPVS